MLSGSVRIEAVDKFEALRSGGFRGAELSIRDLLKAANALVTVDDMGGNTGPWDPFVWLYMRLRFAAIACSLVGVVSGLSPVWISKLRSGANKS